jgi:hypothetical protein
VGRWIPGWFVSVTAHRPRRHGRGASPPAQAAPARLGPAFVGLVVVAAALAAVVLFLLLRRAAHLA